MQKLASEDFAFVPYNIEKKREFKRTATPPEPRKEVKNWLECTRLERLSCSELGLSLSASRKAINAASDVPDNSDLLYECYLERAHAIHDAFSPYWESSLIAESFCSEVIFELDRAMELRPDRPEAHWWKLYYLRLQLGEVDPGSVQILEQMQIDAPWFNALLACWHRHVGSDEAAFAEAQQAVEADPDQGLYLLQRGRAAEALGKKWIARNDYQEYLKRCGPYNEGVMQQPLFPTPLWVEPLPRDVASYLVVIPYEDPQDDKYCRCAIADMEKYRSCACPDDAEYSLFCPIAEFECSSQGRMDAMTHAYHLAESRLLRQLAHVPSDQTTFHIFHVHDSHMKRIDSVDYRKKRST